MNEGTPIALQAVMSKLDAMIANAPILCACNDEKFGMQVCIRVTSLATAGSFEMAIRGELPDGTWIEFLNYSLPENIEETISKIPRLLAAWETMAKHPISATQ